MKTDEKGKYLLKILLVAFLALWATEFAKDWYKVDQTEPDGVAAKARDEELSQLDRILEEWEAVLVTAKRISPSVDRKLPANVDQTQKFRELNALASRGILSLGADQQLTYFRIMSYNSDNESICARQSINRLTAEEKRKLLIDFSQQLSIKDRATLQDLRIKSVVAAAKGRQWLAIADELREYAPQVLAGFPEVQYQASLETADLSAKDQAMLCLANKNYTQRILQQKEPLRSALIAHHIALLYNISDYLTN